MFDLWRIKRKRRKAEQRFREAKEKLRKNKNATSDEYRELGADEYFTLRDYDEWIDTILSERLWQEARELDVVMPSFEDKNVWRDHDDNEGVYLTSNGRFQVRKLIDEEKTRRFEVTTRWVKLIAVTLVPVLTAAAGFIGAMIGWAALHLPKK